MCYCLTRREKIILLTQNTKQIIFEYNYEKRVNEKEIILSQLSICLSINTWKAS